MRADCAVILAAGKGRRLGALTQGRSKALLKVGGRSLLAHSLAQLAAGGIQRVLIVTGHDAGGVREEAQANAGPMRIELLHNDDAADSGSLRSLWLAMEALEDEPKPVLVLECDILYHADLLAAAQGPGAKDRLVVADASGSGDEVFVIADARGRLQWLGKAANADQREAAAGELAGITRCSQALRQAFRQAARSPKIAANWHRHYEELLLELAVAEHAIQVVHRPLRAWTEIDTVADLKRARSKVWPRLIAQQQSHPWP